MAIEIIGAGLGRTGTMSLRSALVQLGYPCYHMMDLMFDPARKGDVDFWLEVADDPDRPDRDWNRVFSGLRATVDFPACAAWRGLAAAYPDAKVILTRHPRGAEAWYDSNRATIYSGTGFESRSEFGAKFNAMMDSLVWGRLLDDSMDDRARAIERYNAHLEEVRAGIPADRLLDFSVDQGWEPLCDFLGVPVPETPFPQVNEREHMARITSRLQLMRRLGAAAKAKK